MEESGRLHNCPNCNSFNVLSAKYCNQCKQKVGPLRVTVGDFISEFINSVFNIENKFFKSVFHAFVPAKLTTAFFQGKRASYYHPLRLYFVIVLLFFFVLSMLDLTNILGIQIDSLDNDLKSEKLVAGQKPIIKASIDSFKLEHSTELDTSLLDTLYSELFFVIKEDSIFFDRKEEKDSVTLDLLFEEVRMSNDEMFVDDIDLIIESHNIRHWFDEFVLRQILKIVRDLKSLNNFIISHLTWLFIAVIPIFALVLKLFYIRRKRYYLEHYVFLLHLFSGLLMISILFVLLMQVEALKSSAIALLALVFLIFPFVALKKYYGQGLIKTLLKYFLIGIFFSISLLICFGIFFIMTAVLF